MLLRMSVACAIAVVAIGCNKSPSYDMATPEATLASFEKAINDGRIPADLGRLVLGDVESRQWRMRCESRGCKKASFRVVDVVERGEYTAVVTADFEVRGDLDGIVMAGEAAPIRFERDGKRWFIARIGAEKKIQLEQPKGRPIRSPPADAGVQAGDATDDAGAADGG